MVKKFEMLSRIVYFNRSWWLGESYRCPPHHRRLKVESSEDGPLSPASGGGEAVPNLVGPHPLQACALLYFFYNKKHPSFDLIFIILTLAKTNRLFIIRTKFEPTRSPGRDSHSWNLFFLQQIIYEEQTAHESRVSQEAQVLNLQHVDDCVGSAADGVGSGNVDKEITYKMQ